MPLAITGIRALSDSIDVEKTVTPFPKEALRTLPEQIVDPAEKGLDLVVSALIQRFGGTGAYNRLVGAASKVRETSNGNRAKG